MFGREKTRKLIENIDRYFDLMDKTVLVFKDGVRNYLYSNKNDFNENLQRVSSLEAERDRKCPVYSDCTGQVQRRYHETSGEDKEYY